MNNLIAATYCPLTPDGSLNLSIVSLYGHFLKRNGVAGAFVNGSTGDFPSMSTQERKDLVEEWVRSRPDGFKVVNHVGHTSLNEAKELARHCAGLVDGIAALAPYYFRLNRLDDLLEYCEQIAACAPEVPFYYYHIPVLTGANFKMIEFVEAAERQIPSFAGIKFTEDNQEDFAACTQYQSKKYKILFGVDEKLVDSLTSGASGWVGSTYNHLAPLYQEVIRSYQAGDDNRARELQAKAVSFVEFLNELCGFNGAGKSFMKQLGLDLGPTRFPHRALTNDQAKTAMDFVISTGLYPFLSGITIRSDH